MYRIRHEINVVVVKILRSSFLINITLDRCHPWSRNYSSYFWRQFHILSRRN